MTWASVHLSWALLVGVGPVNSQFIGEFLPAIVFGAFFGASLLAGAGRILSGYGYGLLALLELGNVLQLASVTSYIPPYTIRVGDRRRRSTGAFVVNAAVVLMPVTRTVHLARERDGWRPVSLF